MQEYRDDFQFDTHLETVESPVCKAARVRISKLSYDEVLLKVVGDSENEPCVVVGLSETGKLTVILFPGCGLEHEDMRLEYGDGNWSLVDAEKEE